MPSSFHPTTEEYLQAIYDMEEDGQTVIQARLAERLSHSPPTVSLVIKKLLSEGDISKNGRGIRLTHFGKKKAENVVRKHRLAERLLFDILGLEWNLVHEEAGKWEHVISDVVADRIAEITMKPSTCPHGNPIPGENFSPNDNRIRLSDSIPGIYTIVRIGEEIECNPKLIANLYKFNVFVGVSIEVVNIDDSHIRLKKDAKTLKFETDKARSIWITKA